MSHLARLLAAVRRLHEATPALRDFGPWPDDLTEADVAPVPCPAAEALGQKALSGTLYTAPVIRALKRAAPLLEWRRTYTEEEVGKHFLDTYGYVELFGPKGHFRSQKLRGYLAYWGPGLTYDWHAHEAEELYFTLSGRAIFSAQGIENAVAKVGDTRQHRAFQRHLMLTLDRHYVAYALWRGNGLADTPKMSAA